jgi:hypothetical protein
MHSNHVNLVATSFYIYPKISVAFFLDDFRRFADCRLANHEGIVAFTLWPNSISGESCQVYIHNLNSQWSQVSILYQNIEALYICPHILVRFSCGTKSQLVSFSLDLKNCIHFSVQFTWILCLV